MGLRLVHLLQLVLNGAMQHLREFHLLVFRERCEKLGYGSLAFRVPNALLRGTIICMHRQRIRDGIPDMSERRLFRS